MISLSREKMLSELEQSIGYSFRSRALLERALTHRSFANERVEEGCRHNEALEFLGDAILGFVVSAWLMELFPNQSEGKLSKMKAFLVSEASLAERAEAIELGNFMLLNRGEEKTGGRRKRALLADTYEAIIGAIYMDSGIQPVERFLHRELAAKVGTINPGEMIGDDYKSALQERLQAAGGPMPEYVLIETSGPDHRRTFRIELRVGGSFVSSGEGSTIKIAQQEAAHIALASMDCLPASDPAKRAVSCDTSSQGNPSPSDCVPAPPILDDYAQPTCPELTEAGEEPVEAGSGASKSQSRF